MHHDFKFWALAIAGVGAFTVLAGFLGYLLKNALTKKSGEK